MGEQLRYRSPRFYFDGLPAPFRTTKTDADGKFQMQVPRSGSYAVAALASREAGPLGETYCWVLLVNPHEKSPAKIMLANDNLFESETGDWLHPVDATAQSLRTIP